MYRTPRTQKTILEWPFESNHCVKLLRLIREIYKEFRYVVESSFIVTKLFELPKWCERSESTGISNEATLIIVFQVIQWTIGITMMWNHISFQSQREDRKKSRGGVALLIVCSLGSPDACVSLFTSSTMLKYWNEHKKSFVWRSVYLTFQNYFKLWIKSILITCARINSKQQLSISTLLNIAISMICQNITHTIVPHHTRTKCITSFVHETHFRLFVSIDSFDFESITP